MKKQGKKMRQGILRARQAGSGARIGAPLNPPPLLPGMIEPFKFGDAEKRELTLLRAMIPNLRNEVRRAEVAAGGYFVQLKSLEAEFQRMGGEHADGMKLLGDLTQELCELVAESGGVFGLHLNGDPSPWDEILEGGKFERLKSLNTATEWLQRKLKEYGELIGKQAGEREALKEAVQAGRFRLMTAGSGRTFVSAHAAEEAAKEAEGLTVVRAEVGKPVDFGDGILDPGK